MKQIADETDIVKQHEALAEKVNELEGKVSFAEAAAAAKAAENAALTEKVAALTASLAESQAATKAAEAQRDALAAEKATLESRVASQVSRFGIAGNAIPSAKSEPSPEKRQTATEKCLAAKSAAQGGN